MKIKLSLFLSACCLMGATADDLAVDNHERVSVVATNGNVSVDSIFSASGAVAIEKTGTDALNNPIYSVGWTSVHNVIVGRPDSSDISDTLTIYGKKIVYWIGIPKGDTHVWQDRKIQLPAPFNMTVRTFGFVETGIQDLIPLAWGGRIASEVIE
jgi:hypothetical protein